MGCFELLLLALGLSMDAFAAALCKGLALGMPRWRQAAVPGLWFGAFQRVDRGLNSPVHVSFTSGSFLPIAYSSSNGTSFAAKA